jgi:phenylacetate-CoA ligase
MSPGGRELIEREFGIPVVSLYNAVEAFKIAFTCEARTGFHVHADLCHVRLVDPEGRPAAAGESGEVVISNLVNRATVLLNYRLGDVAAMAQTACPCGRSLPLLADLEGRREDVLQLADGRVVHPRAVWRVFKPRPEVLQYQLVQHAPDRFELQLATANQDAYGRVIGDLARELADLLGPGASVEFSYRERAIPRSVSKFRPVVSLVGQRAAP